MTEDMIRYDILVQNALRGVIRKVLTEVGKTGLPGNHHFFITFVTNAPGVKVSNRMREQYPDQMTIVLQHQFWDLDIGDTAFDVGLSFSDIPEKLHIPYAAIRGFYDPSVNFELEFDVENADESGFAAPGTVEQLTEATIEPAPQTGKKPKKAGNEDDAAAAADAKEEHQGSADVVSLDSFRKNK